MSKCEICVPSLWNACFCSVVSVSGGVRDFRPYFLGRGQFGGSLVNFLFVFGWWLGFGFWKVFLLVFVFLLLWLQRGQENNTKKKKKRKTKTNKNTHKKPCFSRNGGHFGEVWQKKSRRKKKQTNLHLKYFFLIYFFSFFLLLAFSLYLHLSFLLPCFLVLL